MSKTNAPYFIEIILDDEEWVELIYPDIQPGKYMLSNYGRVYSKHRNRILTKSVNANGYVVTNVLDTDGNPITRRVNRLVALHFIEGQTDERNQVNHKDGFKENNYYKNLEWMSSLENNRHAIENDLARKLKGAEHPNTVYPDEVIIRICELLERAYKGTDISKIIAEEYPHLNYTHERLTKYINDKIKKRNVRTDISSKYNF